MARKRKTYTAGFNLRVVRMITDQKPSVAELTRRLDVGENLLLTRKKAFLERGGGALPGHGDEREHAPTTPLQKCGCLTFSSSSLDPSD